MSTVPERNILSTDPRRKQSPPTKEMTIPTVPDPEVFPSSLEVISATENLLISFAMMFVLFSSIYFFLENFFPPEVYKKE
jgi:hypothetical protein